MDNEHSGSMNSGSDAVASAPAKTAEERTGLVAQTGAALSKVSEAAQQAGSHVREAATSLATEAGEKAKGFIDQQVSSGADFLGYIGHSATVAADTLHPDAPQLAGLVRRVATSVTELSDTVRGQSPAALLETASDYVRQNPGLVLSTAAACGFALARLLQGSVWNGSRSNVRPGNSGTMSQSNAI
jgi:ElaB/YqjD/DUF883 family membrane-anchored ribosome-binding protein